MSLMIPDGFVIVAVGMSRGRSKYSGVMRWLEIDSVNPDITFIQRIWDDNSSEFDQVWNETRKKFEEQYVPTRVCQTCICYIDPSDCALGVTIMFPKYSCEPCKYHRTPNEYRKFIDSRDFI